MILTSRRLFESCGTPATGTNAICGVAGPRPDAEAPPLPQRCWPRRATRDRRGLRRRCPGGCRDGGRTWRWSTGPPATGSSRRSRATRPPSGWRCCSSIPAGRTRTRRGGAATRRAGHPRRAGARRRARHPHQAAGRTKGLQEEIVAQAKRLEALLFEDPLTGLSNRRFDPHPARRHGQRRPPPRPPAVGRDDRHRPVQARSTTPTATPTGDACIAAVAHSIREHLRAEDQLGRLGGEEFLAILPETDASAPPTAAAEHMRENVAGNGVTISVGWATWAGRTPTAAAPGGRCAVRCEGERAQLRQGRSCCSPGRR